MRHEACFLVISQYKVLFTINKINKAYNPIGYKVSIPIGPLASQNPPHFYMRIVPKYKEGYGSVGIKSVLGKSFAPEVAEDAKKLFQLTDKTTIVAQKGVKLLPNYTLKQEI